MARADQFNQPRAPFGGVAAGDEAFDHRIDAGRHLRGRQAEIKWPHHFALAHRNAADDLGKIFAEPDANQKVFDLAKRALAGHARGVGRELPHRFDISGKPGEPVGRALLAVEQAPDQMAFHDHALTHFGRCVPQQGVEGRAGLAGEFDQFGVGAGGTGSGGWHELLGRQRRAQSTVRVHCTKAKPDGLFRRVRRPNRRKLL